MTFVIICLDGFRYDYMEKTDFLKKLAHKSRYGEIYHGLGYTSEFSAITGKDTEELGAIANFVYVLNGKGIRFFKLFKGCPIKERLRLPLNLLYNIKEFLVGNKQPKSIFNIPFDISNYFDFLLKKNIFIKNSLLYPTIFDALRDKKINGYMWPFIFKNNQTCLDISNLSLNTTNTDERAFKQAINLLEGKPNFCYIHFFSADNLVHKLGIDSVETEKIIKRLDEYVKKLSSFADKLLIFSDHGMVKVTEVFNIWKKIDNEGCVLGEDYVMFLDSTLARFWFKNKLAEKKIKNILLKSKKGRIMRFKNKNIHEKFGELIFQVNPGILILPNFYQSNQEKAMHGYSDKCKEERGFYVFYKKIVKPIKKDMKIKEIYNIILNNT